MASFLETMLGGVAAGIGFTLGVGGTLAGAQRMRPMIKQALKGYLVASQRARETAAVVGENLDDLYAEARAEYEAEIRETPPAESPSAAHVSP